MTLTPSDNIDLVFRAFSDRTRLRILNLLQAPPSDVKNGTGKKRSVRMPVADSANPATPVEICVCDLMRVLELPQAKVSRHLAYLRKAGLVQGRKIHRWMYYRLLPAKSQFHQQMLDCLAICPAQLKILRDDRKQMGQCDCNDPQSCC